MKTPFLLILLVLGLGLLSPACGSKPVKGNQLFAFVGSDPVGGPMRSKQDRDLQRNPPKLPNIIVEEPALAENTPAEPVPPPPPFDNEQVTAAPTISSPVPEDADAYFEGTPVQTSALGALFQSIFQPPNNQPTSTGSATYRVVP